MTGLASTKLAGGHHRIMSTMNGLQHHLAVSPERKLKAAFYFQVMLLII